jgi:hypothetical protein
MSVNYVISDGIISLVIDGELIPPIVPSHNSHRDILRAIWEGNIDAEHIRGLLEKKKIEIKKIEYCDLIIDEDGNGTYSGIAFPSKMCSRIREIIGRGQDPMPIVRFLNRAIVLPTHNREALFDFIERGNLPICEDGMFLAFKSITPDFKDWWTQTVDNSVGANPTMERLEGDSDNRVNCSRGYHIGTPKYAGSYHSGQNIILVQCDPEDVISIPNDSSCGKIRTLEYLVLDVLDKDSMFNGFDGDEAIYDVHGNKKKIDNFATFGELNRHLEEDDEEWRDEYDDDSYYDREDDEYDYEDRFKPFWLFE